MLLMYCVWGRPRIDLGDLGVLTRGVAHPGPGVAGGFKCVMDPGVLGVSVAGPGVAGGFKCDGFKARCAAPIEFHPRYMYNMSLPHCQQCMITRRRVAHQA
eukprot:3363928-Pyramimonas_sp.AAC.3